MFTQVADIQTSDMLNLPVPKLSCHNVAVKSSEYQKAIVDELAQRAENCRSGAVKQDEDNMLVITNDGKKLALDQRLINPLMPDFEDSKVNTCAENVYQIWNKTQEQKSTQAIFCDLSTPKNDGMFNVYDDLKMKLIAKGVPENEIAFIHDANTDARKKELYTKVRKGGVRILLGSTAKVGTGTNIQDLLIATHDLDVQYRPSDLEQRLGRMVRQGNTNSEVELYRYVTEGTFDAYCYQIVESKQKFISQIITSRMPVRGIEEHSSEALSYAEIKALATGNPKIIRKMQLETDMARLKLLKTNYLNEKYDLQDKTSIDIPNQIESLQRRIINIEADIVTRDEKTLVTEDSSEKIFAMKLSGIVYDERKEAGEKLIELCRTAHGYDITYVGDYRGFKIGLRHNLMQHQFEAVLSGNEKYFVPLSESDSGNKYVSTMFLESSMKRLWLHVMSITVCASKLKK